MRKYEGLFILNTAGKDETVKEIIDRISAEIESAGGKVHTIQKMDKRPFARISDNRVTSGFYLNIIFEIAPSGLPALRGRIAMNEDIYRVLFTLASPIEAGAVSQPV